MEFMKAKDVQTKRRELMIESDRLQGAINDRAEAGHRYIDSQMLNDAALTPEQITALQNAGYTVDMEGQDWSLSW